MTCPSCGATAPDGARFCPSCGHALVSRPDERRIATVLFADLVGFTTFSEAADPETVKNLVDQCFEQLVADLTAFGGQVDKIIGDAIVALFGAPIAHEDDAERAVRAALQMQRTLAELRHTHRVGAEMRVGVNTGEVLVGALRAGGDYTAMGDVVNTASRLQSIARPGQVVVGPITYEATRRSVRYEPLGALVVKGRESAVEAWVALETVAPPGHRHGHSPTPFVGREPEMALLRRLLDAALTRERAQLILLFGEAGVGKTRLANELAAIAQEECGAMVLRGPCVPYGEANVWWPIAETIRQACGLDGEGSTEKVRAKVEETVALALDAEVHDAEVERTADGLLFMLGRFDERGDVDPARARDDALRSVQTFFVALAQQRSLVLVLSDFHWADEQVLQLVDRLLVGLRALPFVIAVTARPELEDRWTPAPGRHNAAVVNLDPLDREATLLLVRDLLAERATPDLVELLSDRSGGNPLFVEELAALIRESRNPVDVDALAALGSVEVPVALRGLVAARLDSLDPEERSILESCAVVGSTGTVEAVAALSALPGVEVRLESLADRDLISLEDDEFRFRSELIREVAYGTLTKAERARRHARHAKWLTEHTDEGLSGDESIERLAHHYSIAAELVVELGMLDGVPVDLRTRASEVLTAAGERAQQVEAWNSARRHYDQALAVLPVDAPVEWRWRLRLGGARARLERRELADARAELEAVLEDSRAIDDHTTVARALTLLADLEQKEGNLGSSDATYAEALALWRQINDAQGVADALRGRGMTSLFRGELEIAEAQIIEALESFRELGDRRGEAWALQNLAWISFTGGRPTEAEERINQSAATFADIGDWGGLSWALGLLAWVRYNQGYLEEAEQLAAGVLEDSGDSGNRWANAMMEVLLANVALWTGRIRLAIQRAENARTQFRDIADRWGELQSFAPAARALACLGKADEAERVRREVELLVDVLGDRGLVGVPAIVAAGVAAHMGDADRSAAELQLAESKWSPVIDAGEEGFGFQELRVGHARVLVQQGRPAEAMARIEDWAGSENAGFVAASGGIHALACAGAGATDRAIELTDRLVELDTGSYLDHLEAWIARALALAQRGDEDAAREACEMVLGLADTTESILDQAIARLARAHVLDALGAHDAGSARAEARSRLDALGITAAGWDLAFRVAATGAPVS
jgi:class 3 adenylate cyclase/tetratricopeptide (TPR) repeat protein